MDEFKMDEFKNLKSVKAGYDEWENYFGLFKCQIDWLIEQAEQVERYKEALKFYANEENYEAWDEYQDTTGYFNNVDQDSGDTARRVLGK